MDLEQKLGRIEGKLEDANRRLAVCEANRVGATVQAQVLLDALRTAQPNHPLLQASG